MASLDSWEHMDNELKEKGLTEVLAELKEEIDTLKEELSKRTIFEAFFDVKTFSRNDAEKLRKVADLIERKLVEKETNENKKT